MYMEARFVLTVVDRLLQFVPFSPNHKCLLNTLLAFQAESMVSRVALVGASNLVSFERQPWETCTCQEPCKIRSHSPQVPTDIVYKSFAMGGARFEHPNYEKDARKLFEDALMFSPHMVVMFHDVVMNSLTLPPHAPPNSQTLTPPQVMEHLKKLQRNCPGRFVVVLVRRKKEDAHKLPPGTNRRKGDKPRLFENNLDKQMNDLIKTQFEFFDLNLSNASFKMNDPAHQTADSMKMSVGKIVKFYG